MLKTLIIATVLLPVLAFAQQLPQPRQPGQWCPVGWVASGNYCVPGPDKGTGTPVMRFSVRVMAGLLPAAAPSPRPWWLTT